MNLKPPSNVRPTKNRPNLAMIVVALLALTNGEVALADEAVPSEAMELPEGLSRLPTLLEMVRAEYPPQALEEEVQADVLIEITVNETGAVQQANPLALHLYRFDADDELLEETLFPEMDTYGFVAGAMAAIIEFTFEPALDDEGQPVPVTIIWRFGFYFEEEEQVVLLDDVSSEVNLMGTLYERGTREGLTDVLVTVSQGDLEVSTTTNQDGLFEFIGLPEGVWILNMQPEGFEAIETNLEIVFGERTIVDHHLEREDYGEYTFEVRAETVRREVSRQTMSVVEINRVPGNFGDAIKIVQNLPGVSRAAFGAGVVVVRGSSPEDTRFFIDGAAVPLAFHFGGLNAVVNSDILAQLEFIPGAFSTEYGRATGGIINIDTRAPHSETYRGFVDVDLFDTNFLIEGPIVEDWSFFASARRSYIDLLLVAFLPDDALASLTVAPRYWDYQGRLQYDPSAEHSLSLLLYGSDDSAAALVDQPGGPGLFRGSSSVYTGFHRAQFEWLAELHENVSNRLMLSLGYQDIGSDVGEDLLFRAAVLPSIAFRNRLEIRPLPWLRIRPGLDIEFWLTDVLIRGPRFSGFGTPPNFLNVADYIEIRLDDAVVFNPAAFLELEVDVLPGVTLVPGIRFDWFDPPERGSIDLRLAARWDLNERWRVKGAVGTFHQPPQVFEVLEIYGNPDLGLEWAIHTVIGGEVDITEALNLDLQLFYKDLNDLVVPSSAIVERDGQQVNEMFNNQGEGRVYGLELLIRQELANNLFGWLAYTLSRSERRLGPDDDWGLFWADQTHILALIASYNLGSGWSVGGRFRYVTGPLVTPVIGSIYDPVADFYYRVRGEPYSVRQTAFHQLDLRVDKQFQFNSWVLDVYLDVQNVYNHRSVEGTRYNYDYSESTPTLGLPIIPSIGLRGSF